MNLSEHQANSVLKTVSSQLTQRAINASGEVESDKPFDPDLIRTHILQNLANAKARLALDGQLFVLVNHTMVILKPVHYMGAVDLVQVTGTHYGTEEYDGEDAAVYTFWMNQSSIKPIRDRLVNVPRVSSSSFLQEMFVQPK